MRLTAIVCAVVAALAGGLTVSAPAQASPVSCPVAIPPGYLVRHWTFPLTDRDPRIPLPGNAKYGLSFGQLGDLTKEIRPGDVIRVRATGTVHYGGFLGLAGEWGPDGKTGDIADTGWPAPGLNKYSIYGMWNQDATPRKFRIGADSGCLTVPAGIGNGSSIPYILLIRLNDTDFGDNTKAYGLTIDWFQLDRA